MKNGIELVARVARLMGAGLLAAAALAPPAAAESGNAARGRALAERFCAKCHAVAPGRTGPELAVPSFMRMAADPEQTRASLRQFIMLPHYEMQPQTLTSAEIDDVIAYILSLRR
jgi:mono/diheme cytochrome c family protein